MVLLNTDIQRHMRDLKQYHKVNMVWEHEQKLLIPDHIASIYNTLCFSGFTEPWQSFKMLFKTFIESKSLGELFV